MFIGRDPSVVAGGDYDSVIARSTCDEAIQLSFVANGLLRCARNDGVESLQRVAVGFAGPDPQCVIDRRHEDLAVADLAGARA
jgi:hypothetical protein